jgi:flagellar export protein FliJ|nr:flagellar export protein FliJ [Pseudomaricurvus alkylphenolicus]
MVVVLQLVERAEQNAADGLRHSRQQVEQGEQQLQQITAYQQEYVQRLNQPRSGLHAESIINDRRFLQQLMDVQQSQQQQLQQLKQAEEQALKNWQLCYRRRQSIEQLIERLKQGENQLLEKQLQKELDELSGLARLTRQ